MIRLLPILAVGLLLGACDTIPFTNQGSAIPDIANRPHVAATTMRSAPRTVTVQNGETLFTIATKYGVTSRAVIEANNLTPPYRLAPGQTLTIPGQASHTVVRGDTLYGISRAYGIDAFELARLNNLPPPYKILVGQNLILPGGDPRPATVVEKIDRAVVASPRVDVAEVASLPPPSASSASAAPAPRMNSDVVIGSAALPPQAQSVTAQPAIVTQPTPVAQPAVAEVSAPALPSAPVTSSPRAEEPPPQVASVSPEPRIVRPAKPSKFMWPVEGKVVSEYGAKGDGLHNDGINIIAAKGTVVRAAAAGTVAYAGNEVRGFGNLLLIRHADGWMTAYAHNDKLLVKRGDTVEQGQEIAEVGQTGNVTSPQLHFEIRRGKRAVDPLDQLSSQQALNR